MGVLTSSPVHAKLPTIQGRVAAELPQALTAHTAASESRGDDGGGVDAPRKDRDGLGDS